MSLCTTSTHATSKPRLPYTLDTLHESMQLIKAHHFQAFSDDVMIKKAIDGLLQQLDPHSGLLDQQDLKRFKEQIDGNLVGIGVSLIIEKGQLTVITPLANTPAERAGLRQGDIITHVNQKLISHIGYNEAIQLIKGPAGTKVTITYQSKQKKRPITVTLVRESINLPSTQSQMIGDHVLHLKVSYFQKETASDIRKSVMDFMGRKNKLGIILDLRNNPGGLFNSAIDSSQLFLEAHKLKFDRVLIKTKFRQKKEKNYRARSKDISKRLPMVILINAATASSAEIMASTLKTHKRAIILGQPSFGKGSIQSLVPLSNGAALKITSAVYYSADGQPIQSRGVTPDIETSPVNSKTEPIPNIREHQLIDSILPDSSSEKKAPVKPQMTQLKKLITPINGDQELATALLVLQQLKLSTQS